MFEKRKKKQKTEEISVDMTENNFGEEITIFNGPYGESRAKAFRADAFLPTGEEWCPNCHVKMAWREGDIWDCPICEREIDMFDVNELGESHPTLEASYADDFGDDYISDIDKDEFDDMPSCCIGCGCDAYPDCMKSCKLFDD